MSSSFSECLCYFSLLVFSAAAVSLPHTNGDSLLPPQRTATIVSSISALAPAPAPAPAIHQSVASMDEASSTLLRSESLSPARAGRSTVVDKAVVGSDNGAVSAVVSSQGMKYFTPQRNHSSSESAYTVSAGMELIEEDETDEPRHPVNVPKNGTSNGTTGRELVGAPTRPHKLYFGIGVATFLFACAMMVLYTQKLGFRQVAGEVVLFQNPQDEEPQAREASVDVTHPGNRVPYRLQQVLISWISIFASIAYFCDYLALQAGLEQVRHWFGAVASLLWLFGFLLHLHWQHSVGTSWTQIGSSHLKAWSCVFQQVHPLAMIMGAQEYNWWVWWPPFLGILLWHIGNLISSIDFACNPPLGATRNGSLLSHGNIPVTEVWIDQLATWLLLIAVISITEWGGHPTNQLAPVENVGVTFCQFGGATFFLLGSVLRCEWCNGFRNVSHQAA